MNRSYYSLAIVALMTSSAMNCGTADAVLARGGHVAIEQSLRMTILIFGALAVRGIGIRSASAQRYLTAWTASVVGLLVAQDVGAGFFRPGVADRLFVTCAVGVLLLALTWQRSTLERTNR